MITRTVACVLLSLFTLELASAQGDSSARLLPTSTVIYAELNDPERLVSTIFDHPLRDKIEQLPPYQMALKSKQFKDFENGRAFIEAMYGITWREAVKVFAEQGVTFAFDGTSQGSAMIVRGKDAESMTKFLDKLLIIIRAGENADKLKTAEYRGITAHEMDEARFAVHGDQLVITNKGELGKAILDRLIDGEGESFADNPRFQTARDARRNDLSMWAFVDVTAIRESGTANDVYERRIDNPVLELLVGGIQSSLKETPYLTVGFSAESEGLGLRFSMPHQAKWVPEEREYYFGPEGVGRGPQLPGTDQTLFTLSTYRDVSEMWLRAGDLFGEQTNDGFAQADANLTTLFAGRDFGEDILGSMEPEVGLIATRQDFTDVLPRPTIKVPAFALVLELREPETMTRELRRIFQSLVGFLNVIGAMNGQNQLELDMEKLDGDIELITSTFVPEDDDRESTEAKIIFNFSPSVAFAGRRFVVSSTKGLAKELAMKPSGHERIRDNSRVVLQADVLQQVLDDNRSQLIAQNMLEDGNSREEAEAVIDLLLEVVGFFRDASLRLGTSAEELDVEFQVRVKQ